MNHKKELLRDLWVDRILKWRFCILRRFGANVLAPGPSKPSRVRVSKDSQRVTGLKRALGGSSFPRVARKYALQ